MAAGDVSKNGLYKETHYQFRNEHKTHTVQLNY